ncbi:putative receptor protein kinase ZmPK1 [Bienertia sinuspersici]
MTFTNCFGKLGSMKSCWNYGPKLDHNHQKEYEQNLQLEKEMENNLRNYTRVFSYKELQIATNNFSSKLGMSDFSSCYKGTLEDETKVAVKVFMVKNADHKLYLEFLALIKIMSEIQHQNVVTLIGCCIDNDHIIIVYEFMEGGSLAALIDDKIRDLSWAKRASICLGIAQGLEYLHNHALHRDLRPSNVLLDSSFNPKIVDFGITNLFAEYTEYSMYSSDGNYMIPKNVSYMAPEYMMYGRWTKKRDVYGFGVVLLEVISGKRFVKCLEDGKKWVRQIGEYGSIKEVIDTTLSEYPEDEVKRIIDVAFSCIQFSSDLRPSMSEVCLTLLAKNFLSRGTSVTVKEALNSDNLIITSSDKTFSCGFSSFGPESNAYYFSIWFTNSKDRTVVWTANRDKPVNRLGSRLRLRKNGVLVLTDYDGSIAWETNTTSTNADKAELLNTGNLVLKDINGNILWQSFDIPTDTLLPNQLFTKKQRLVSRTGPQMLGSGYFSFFFDSDNVIRMIYDGPEISSIYWPNIAFDVFQNGRTNYNNSRIAMLDKTGSFSSSDQLQFSASDSGIGSLAIKRRLTLDIDGNLRLYSLSNESGLWNITWQAIAKLCDIHGLCGRNGICVNTPNPKCSCPPYYEPIDSSDLSKGCKPKFHRSCSDSEFVELNHVDYYGFDLNYSKPASYEGCKQLCLDDCRCQAFSYRLTGEGMCFTKNALFNGFRSLDFPGSMHLRIPRNVVTSKPVTLNVSRLECGGGQGKLKVLPNTYDTINQRFKWVYLYSFAIAIGALEAILLVVGWWFLFKKHGFSASMEDGYHAISNQFRSFSYNELKNATRKFKEVLGRGGFGDVYKGILDDDRVVAVKKLGNVVHGEEEFWAEVSTIGKIYHMNLARMWGFCSEKKHRLLVYEYVENGSLDKHLFLPKTRLGWKDRFKVALGTARGLAYLHHECLEWVIHCDVKPENILLDGDFEPKISDFGLAKLCQRGGHGSSELTRIRGTKGYMAPEWAINLPITAKVDVYSYGVVILELVKGIRLSTWVMDEEQLGSVEVPELVKFVRLAKRKMKSGDDSWVEELIDPRLEGSFSRNQAAMMIEVGLSCVQDDRNQRPTMESVAQVLAECEDDVLM